MPRPDTDEFFGLVYTELRRLAAQHLRRERSNHTLQPTVSHIPTGDFIMGATKRIFGCRLIRAGIVLAGLGMASGQQPAPASKAASPSKATKQVSIIDPVPRLPGRHLRQQKRVAMAREKAPPIRHRDNRGHFTKPPKSAPEPAPAPAPPAKKNRDRKS